MEADYQGRTKVMPVPFMVEEAELKIIAGLDAISQELIRGSKSLKPTSVFPNQQVYIICGGYPRDIVIFSTILENFKKDMLLR